VTSCGGRMGESERQVNGLFESLPVLGFVEGLVDNGRTMVNGLSSMV
jgi:hypothetical protein